MLKARSDWLLKLRIRSRIQAVLRFLLSDLDYQLMDIPYDLIWKLTTSSVASWKLIGFNETIIPFALVGYETGYSELGATRLVVYLPSHIHLIVNY